MRKIGYALFLSLILGSSANAFETIGVGVIQQGSNPDNSYDEERAINLAQTDAFNKANKVCNGQAIQQTDFVNSITIKMDRRMEIYVVAKSSADFSCKLQRNESAQIFENFNTDPSASPFEMSGISKVSYAVSAQMADQNAKNFCIQQGASNANRTGEYRYSYSEGTIECDVQGVCRRRTVFFASGTYQCSTQQD